MVSGEYTATEMFFKSWPWIRLRPAGFVALPTLISRLLLLFLVLVGNMSGDWF